MLKMLSARSLIFLVIASIGAYAFGESNQQQSQSPPGSESAPDAHYTVWKNGGGKVHAKATVDPSAEIDPSSKIGPYVVVGKGAKIRQSILMGDSGSAKARIGKSVTVESSTIQGEFILGEGVYVKSSMLQGPIGIKAGVRVISCTLNASIGHAASIDSDLADKIAFLPASN